MASSSSSSSDAPITYNVFLSFRSETRGSFSDNLYADLKRAGVNVFRDDESLPRGEDISVELSRAIEESMISIVVFSKDYARSRWCLDELVKIMECKQKLNQIVYPIFYHVDPLEVSKHTSTFGEALTLHKQRFGDLKVNEWKDALTTAANLPGRDSRTISNGCESKFIEVIIEEVVLVLTNCMPLFVGRHVVGIDYQLREVLDLLQIQTNDDVRMIGIFGMGGVGKSILAKVIYNHLIEKFRGFEHICFIGDIREEVSSKGHNGLIDLQKKLLCKRGRKDFKIDSVDEGKILIKARLQSKRVIIVLDDIDHISQLDSLAGQRNWFGSGSIIIITTRDFRLLSELGAQEKYKVKTLSIDDSLQLLSWHAFGVLIPLEEYTELSKTIANYTGGLPLALEVIGSYLHGKSMQEWIKAVEKLRIIPHNDIQRTLQISYGALDVDTQNILLDIACFFIGHDKKETAMILEARGFHAESGIKTLIERCLLTIDGDREFGDLNMYDLVRDMGRYIARIESLENPGERRRLVDQNDVFDVLQGNMGTRAIEGMYVHSTMLKNKFVSIEVLSEMRNLQLLKLDGVHLKGYFKDLPKVLIWFWWHNCPLKKIPSDFHHKTLEVFHLQGSNITSVQLKMQHFKSLRILNLGGCEQLEETPNFTGAENLQILSFKYCKNLVELSSSVGCLESLIELDLAFCQKLKMLPNSICQLKSLEFLYLNDCSSLEKIPWELGKLGRLRKLLVQNTSISHLPISLGDLRNLKILSVGPPKSNLSDNISHIDSFFPHTVRDLRSLEAFYITHLQSIPFSLCSLSRLEILELEECPNLNQPLQLPPSLLKLSAKNCPSLRKIDISTLKRLMELYIPNCKSLIELPGLENLDSLHRLDITNCSALTIPRTESCYQAYSKGGDVEIWLQLVGSFLYCTVPIPSLLRREFFDIIHGGFDPNDTCEARIIVRSRTTGALIKKKVEHVDCRCLEHGHPLTLHFRLEDGIVINTSERFHFRVRIKVGEEVEVYAVFQPWKIFSLCVLHRNRDGEVRFFPCPKGFTEFVELPKDDATETDHPLASKEEVGNSREKAETGVQIVEIIEESPSREEQKTQFPGQDEIMQSEDISKQFQKKVPPSVAPRHREKKGPSPVVPAVAKKPSLSEQIQKLHGESTRIAADMSKLKRGILELLDVAQLPSEEAMTPELSTLFNMLKLQIKGYTNPLEMTQILLGSWKKHEVERLYQNDTTGSGVVEMEESDPVEEDRVDPLQSDNTVPDVSSDDSETHLPTKKSYNNEGRLLKKPERIDDEVVELFFTPKKFEGLIVVKLGEAIEVTGTGMYSLKPGEMIQDDVINSYEFILRERAGDQPKCWYLPTYICQEAQGKFSDKMYERNFQPYAINSSCGDIIYLPVILNSHWYLVKANTKSRQAFILDSFITYNQQQSRLDEAIKIMGVLHNLLKEHTRRDPTYQYEANFEDWKFETASWVPQQGNGVDCGAFVMLFMEMADHLTKHTEFNIDMERRRIALELFYHPRNARLSSVLKILEKMM